MIVTALAAFTLLLTPLPQATPGWTPVGGERAPQRGSGGCPGGTTTQAPASPGRAPSAGAPGRRAAPGRVCSPGRRPALSGRPAGDRPSRGAPITQASTAGFSSFGIGPDPDGWGLWWQHNKEAFLELEAWNSNPVSGIGGDDRILGGVSRAIIFERVVPALKASLDEDISAAHLRTVLLSLARIGEGAEDSLGSSDLQQLFIEHLDDANIEVAETACIALGVLARPGSLPTLSALLHDTPSGRQLVDGKPVSTRMQAFAAYGIGLLGERTRNADVERFAAHTLVQAMDSEECVRPDARVAAVIALGMIRGSERPVMAPAPSAGGAACACSSHDGLAQRVLDLLEDERGEVRTRAHAPNTLARMAAHTSPVMRGRIVESLLSTAARRDERELVQQGCIQALGHLVDADNDPQDVRTRKRLIKLSSEGRLSARSWATMALAEIGTRRGTDAVGTPAGSREIQALFLRRLARAKSQDEPWIALSLGVLSRGLGKDDPAVAESIGQALRDGLRRSRSPDKMTAYAIALGLCRDAKSSTALMHKLDKVDTETRALVVLAIGMSGEDAGIEALHAGLHDARHIPATLEESARSLALLHDPAVIKKLVALGEECDCTLSKQGVALSLGRTRHPDAVAPLLAQLQSKNETEQIYAAIGLGYLAEKENRPWSARVSTGLHYRAGPATLTGTQAGILDLP